MLPKLAIVYLCYGMKDYLAEIVDALARLEYPKDRLTLLFIPAGSPDGIGQVIRDTVLPRSGKDLAEVVVLDDGQNRGFAGNNNPGLQYAIDQGFDYVFLHNGDLKLAPNSLMEAVRVAEADTTVGAVQSLVRYWHEPNKVNVTGGAIHIAGYGFAKDNGRLVSEVTVEDGEDIAYASGAAVLYRVSALQKVGLLEEGFFMYHEDLELGMRLRFAGYRNVLAAKSFAYHDYKFSRNPKKFAWMELYRNLVVLAYYKPLTLLLFAPLLLVIEAGTWLMALKGGWFKAKLWSVGQWFLPRTWKLLWHMRRRTASLRVIRDADFLRLVTGKIEHQETSSPLMDRFINPTVDKVFKAGRKLVTW